MFNKAGPRLSGPEMMIRGLIGAEAFDAMKQMAEGGALQKFVEFVDGLPKFETMLRVRFDRMESQIAEQATIIDRQSEMIRQLIESLQHGSPAQSGSHSRNAVRLIAGHSTDGFREQGTVG